MTADKQQALERSPNYWWLRLNYSIRSGDAEGQAEARRRLAALGVDVSVRTPESFLEKGPAR